MTDTERDQLGATLAARPHGGLPEVREHVEHLAWLHPRENWSICEWERWWLLRLVDKQAREIARLRAQLGEAAQASAPEAALIPERVAGVTGQAVEA